MPTRSLIGVPYEHGASFGAGRGAGAGGDRRLPRSPDRAVRAPYPDRAGAPLPDRAPDAATMSARWRRTRWSRRSREAVQRRSTRSRSCSAASIRCRSGRCGRMPRAAGRSDVTVLQIDAHLDMRDDDSDYNDRDPSRYAHSCVMRRARELGFRTCSVGIRAYARDEYRYALDASACRCSNGAGRRAARSRPSSPRSRTDRVYLTLDVDGFDPAVDAGDRHAGAGRPLLGLRHPPGARAVPAPRR